jgi:hypothetical protein
MMQIKLVLSKDVAASETSRTERYVFGKPGDAISGGVYFTKGTPLPDEVVLMFKKEAKDA